MAQRTGRFGKEIFVLVVCEGYNGSLGREPDGNQLCKGRKGSIGEGLQGSEAVGVGGRRRVCGIGDTRRLVVSGFISLWLGIWRCGIPRTDL